MRRKSSTEELLSKLREDLLAARGLSTERLAAQIQEIASMPALRRMLTPVKTTAWWSFPSRSDAFCNIWE